MQAGAWSEARLGYLFRDANLLRRALTHRSASPDNNERLEFLGDAVLGTVIAQALFNLKPDAREGELSRYRASLVRGETLAELATELELGELVRLGGGEQRTGGHQRKSVLANALEALFGAVLLDGGYAQAERVIATVYAERLDNLPDKLDLKDSKTRLQEWLQARSLPPPDYRLLEASGAEHAQVFQVVCEIESLSVSVPGSGTSRRRAEQAAAGEVLVRIADE